MTPHASHFSQKTHLAPSPIIYIVDSSHITYLYCTHYFSYIKAVPCISLLTKYIIQSYFAHFQSLFSLSLLILNSFEVIALIRFVHMCNCFLLVINYCFLIFPNFHRFSTSLFWWSLLGRWTLILFTELTFFFFGSVKKLLQHCLLELSNILLQ